MYFLKNNVLIKKNTNQRTRRLSLHFFVNLDVYVSIVADRHQGELYMVYFRTSYEFSIIKKVTIFVWWKNTQGYDGGEKSLVLLMDSIQQSLNSQARTVLCVVSKPSIKVMQSVATIFRQNGQLPVWEYALYYFWWEGYQNSLHWLQTTGYRLQ